ncbi:MAG: DNA-3-methyladenine glycosylase [Lewinellaceae bacterium]|nr:DNA-3-methyladenine glycosylase [Lewinellaceae bacterium]
MAEEFQEGTTFVARKLFQCGGGFQLHKPIFLTKVQPYKRLTAAFYQQTDVVALAQALLGKVLVTNIDGVQTAGIISETEAYRAPDDRASHAWNNRRTKRTETMFQAGGCAYIYLCYGIHHLFNVVTAPEDTAHAVLVRAIEPLEGLDVMLERRGGAAKYTGKKIRQLCSGPGALSQALGLTTVLDGQSLIIPDSPVWIEDRAIAISAPDIATGPRIGVSYAGVSATWPWRFWIKNTII